MEYAGLQCPSISKIRFAISVKDAIITFGAVFVAIGKDGS